MYSNIKLDLVSAKAEATAFDCLPHFCKLPLKWADANRIKINEGNILIQSIAHYLANIELFEYSLTTDSVINFSVSEPSFLMFVTAQGSHLCYSPPGDYKKNIPRGDHAVLILTFSIDWTMRKCKRLPEMQPLITHFQNAPDQYFSLPHSGLASSIFKTLGKLDHKTNHLDVDADIHVFINDTFNKYYSKLISKKTTKTYHQQKAEDIAKFIEEHFATEIAQDLPQLASRFMVSERNLARIAKLAFGIPLHEHVIKTRMKASLHQMIETKKPIYEIARQNGYQDPHYFSKAFKKHFGMPPSQVDRTKDNALHALLGVQSCQQLS
ncbi:AraC family transcriptional regulator [Pedobacter frigoris]|uniref:AraC family transcriptional regulator n=1 Tax=Pedobacter frigoris TaxID=2571272 RepID=UPI00292CF434|nr:AraC family transcriptional regulator [Pedobacter frigoris]